MDNEAKDYHTMRNASRITNILAALDEVSGLKMKPIQLSQVFHALAMRESAFDDLKAVVEEYREAFGGAKKK